MKIVIPVLGFTRSGGARVLSELASHWVEMGHTVDFIVNEYSELPYFPTLANVKWINNFGREVDITKKNQNTLNKLSAANNLFSLFLALSRIGKTYNVILANHSLTTWPIVLANCGDAKVFYYIQAYEPEYYDYRKGFKARILEWMSIQSYKFDFVQICNAPIYIGYKKICALEWVPPGINFNLYYPKSTSRNLIDSHEIILGCIGRKEPVKGIRYVLEAFEVLWEQDKRFQLHVAYGNLPDNWMHPGLKVIVPANDKELANYYRSLDIMIAPGTVQLGAPHYPVMEAMACGVPVITTGYLPADQNNAWIVPIKNSKAIVKAVDEITKNNEQVKTKVANALKAISAFYWTKTADKMFRIFLKNN
jgi:glycosyltransferase involved in cell wall biosynthesis